MQIFQLGEILPMLEDKAGILAGVKHGFISHARGEIDLPNPMQILFERADKSLRADCHVKAASSAAMPYFCIKVASGFYDNPKLGLPVNNGCVLLFSSETGLPLALFQDEGHMTSVRTAAAGALSAQLAGGDRPKRLGIIGTGHQAELQALWIASTMDISEVCLWGRSKDKARALAARLASHGCPAQIAPSVATLSAQSDMLVTTTPSTAPILKNEHVRDDQHIIAMGADSPGKQELDPQILARADAIIVDDFAQCTAHGELGWATRAGLVGQDKTIPLGEALARNESAVSGDGISLVDLTGLGVQDLALAAFVYEKLTSKS